MLWALLRCVATPASRARRDELIDGGGFDNLFELEEQGRQVEAVGMAWIEDAGKQPLLFQTAQVVTHRRVGDAHAAS